MEKQEAIALAQHIEKDSRIKVTVTGNKRYAVHIELKRDHLKHTIHSTKEWNDFKPAWSIFN